MFDSLKARGREWYTSAKVAVRLLRQHLRWFIVRPWWVFWAPLLVIAIAVAAPFYVGTERAFSISGGVLQLFGIGTIVWDLKGRGKQFGLPSLRSRVRGWWSERPQWPKPISVRLSQVGASTSVGTHAPRVWAGVASGATLDDKVDALAKNVDTLREQLDTLRDKQTGAIRQLREHLNSEKKTRTEAVEKLEEQLTAAYVGGIHVGWAGVWFFLLGVVLSTFAPYLGNHAP